MARTSTNRSHGRGRGGRGRSGLIVHKLSSDSALTHTAVYDMRLNASGQMRTKRKFLDGQADDGPSNDQDHAPEDDPSPIGDATGEEANFGIEGLPEYVPQAAKRKRTRLWGNDNGVCVALMVPCLLLIYGAC